MRQLISLVLLGCGVPDPCADIDLADAGLVVTAETHPGWGREECFACHVAARLHPGGCLPKGAVDLEVLRENDQPCADCHGANGIETDDLASDASAEVTP